jgi:hypothetical protein
MQRLFEIWLALLLLPLAILLPIVIVGAAREGMGWLSAKVNERSSGDSE